MMQPEQMRAARGTLNWNLDRLAEESGVHRNTLSNFETRRYQGDPEKLGAIRRALEAAGIVFIEENGEVGVAMRRFQIGDIVRFRRETRAHQHSLIAADERGIVTGLEPHPPQTGPTYRMWVQFLRASVPGVFRFEYELVHTAFTSGEITLLEQLEERDQSISVNRRRDGLARLMQHGYVREEPLNMSDTLYSLTERGRAILEIGKLTEIHAGIS